jgi:hypothetical protein
MANTTLQNILATLRGADILPPAKVNYGITDGLEPPYISVDGFEFEQVYQTCGPATRHSTFHVIVVDKNADAAQVTAQAVLALLDTSKTLTPKTSECLLISYKIGQSIVGDKALYQWVVDTYWRLDENI